MNGMIHTDNRHAGCRGFTLVELIVVIAIIGVIAAIVGTSALRVRMNANEGAVKGALKSLQSSAINYRTSNGAYPANLGAMGSAYVGGGLETGTKNGYGFVMVNANNGETYTVTAAPTTASYTGKSSYCTDTLNVIYVYENVTSLSANGTSCPSGGTPLSS